jgi:co-chaperonin GroES (HSP10)
MKLLNNNILCERVKLPTNPNSKIILPPVALDDNNTGGAKEFRVLAVGPGRRNRKGIVIPVECEPGDRFIAQSYTQGPVEVAPGKFILTDDMILAVLPKGEHT